MLWVKLTHPLAEVPALFFYHPDSLLSPGAHNGCAKNLRYPVAERLATLQAVDV